MLEDHSSLPIASRLHTWADTLPSFAAEVVARSDLTRPHLYTQTTASPDQVRALRHQVTAWTRRLAVPGEHGQDVVLATDEAISNAVDHAYPDCSGPLTLFAAYTQTTDAVRIIVADHGLWHPPPADPGFRGRGLTMMQRLAHVFRLVHGPHGTTVVLGWSLPG